MREKVFNAVEGGVQRLNQVLAWLAAALIVGVSILVAVNVLLRSTMNKSIPGTFEVVEYALVWITFLGAAWLLREDGHVRLDVVVSRLGPRSGRIVNGAVYLVSAGVLALFTWFAIKVTANDHRTGLVLVSELRPPKWPIEIILPIGGLLLIIVCLLKFVKTVLGGPTVPIRRSEPENTDGGEA